MIVKFLFLSLGWIVVPLINLKNTGEDQLGIRGRSRFFLNVLYPWSRHGYRVGNCRVSPEAELAWNHFN